MEKKFGRAKSMSLTVKNSGPDIMDTYFNHPVWKQKWGEPIPDMPLDVQLELINSCNLACDSCPILHQTRIKSSLTWEVLKRIADESAEESVCYFTICGIGEAALHPKLFEFLRYVRNKTVKPKGLRTLTTMPTILISNAVWPQKHIQQCIDHPPDMLSLSLAGLTDEEHIARRSPINLDKFFQNVKALHDGRKLRRPEDGRLAPTIHISTHIYPHEMTNHEAIQAFEKKWLQISDAVVIKPTMIDQHHMRLKEFSTPSNLQYTDISTNHFSRTAPCMETSRRLSIDSNGDIWCGHHNSEDFGPLLGNVYHNSLREIWHSDTMNEFRREVRAGIFHREGCQKCGGEIRDWHREVPKTIEKEIKFQ